MSWAEEEGIDALDVPEYIYNEENWKNGFHVTQDEKIIRLSDMETKHIKNTIRYFSDIDTSPLEEELNKRLNK